MAFCTQCGAKLEDGAKFCTNCGAVQTESPAPSYDAPASEPSNTEPSAPSYSYDPTVYSTPSSGTTTTATKKKGGKAPLIIAAVLIVLAVIAYLAFGKGGSGGGGKSDSDSRLGLYTAQKADMSGFEISIASMWEKGFTIELKSGGKAEVNVDGTKGSAKWTDENGVFTLSGGGLDCSGTLSDGVLVLEDVMGTGIRLTFTKEGAASPDPTPSSAIFIPEPSAGVVESTTEPAADDYTWWEGNWYGWWTSFKAGGKFLDQNYPGCAWDACATIEVYGDTGYIEIWDEDDDGVLWADVSFGPGSTGKGCMTVTDGQFYNDSFYEGEWSADPGVGMLSSYGNVIVISGRYYAEAGNSNDWIDYYIFLRPWGTRWDDIANGDMSDEIYTDMMPIHYSEWYLPLIDAGKPMPDSMNTETTAAAPANTQDSLLGSWIAAKGMVSGMDVPVSTMWEKGFTMNLASDGTCSMVVNGTNGSGTWTYDGTNITIEIPGLTLSGTANASVIIFEDVAGTGVELYFTRDGSY